MKNIVSLAVIFTIFFVTVLVKLYFFEHPSNVLFFLSTSDIMAKAPEFLKKPVPIPYVQSYIEYPVVLGLWATFIGALSKSGREFFLFNGLFLSFFSTLNVFLARKLSQKYFNRNVSLFMFMAPSVILFNFFNWDSLALLLLLFALYLLSRKIVYVGVVLACLGFWTKIFPGFCLVPAFLTYLKERKIKILFLAAFVILTISLALNLPFYLMFPKGWALFFTFSSNRPPNIDSLWSGLYVLTDRFLGEGFYLKRYYDIWVSYLTFGLMVGLSAAYILLKIVRKSNFNLVIDTAFLICVFLLTSKVYSPQYNLWIVPLLLIMGLSYRKIMLYELFNLVVMWSVFQYFWEFFIAGHAVLTFPYFKLTYVFVVLRHVTLLLLAVDVWRFSFLGSVNKHEKGN